MPLQNRVDPFGDLHKRPERGLFMGNRGGRIHDPQTRELTGRIQASTQWICCLTAFNGRKRQIFGPKTYSELFFCDEVTALAAGHRPCYECRRADALRFAEAVKVGLGLSERPKAGGMDRVLDAERRIGKEKKRHMLPATGLPDGAMAILNGKAHALRAGQWLRWNHGGYDTAMACSKTGQLDVLTPPLMLAALHAGYKPIWHPSAEAFQPS
jgi:hypothetical protein